MAAGRKRRRSLAAPCASPYGRRRARIDSLKITLSGDRCLIKNHTSCSRRQRTTGGKDEAKDESEFT